MSTLIHGSLPAISMAFDSRLAQTETDPADGRRTLVRLTPAHAQRLAAHGGRDARAALLAALGDIDADGAQRLLTALGELAVRLRPLSPGPVLGQLEAYREAGRARSPQRKDKP